MSDDSVDPDLWPYEAFIARPDGGCAYHQHARTHEDGTVTVYEFELPGGYVERTYPQEQVRLQQRPWERAAQWYELYERVYGQQNGAGE
jgi:hypothetical protein